MSLNDDITLAQKIAADVAKHGGTAYYVGGCVRDKILNIPCKDIDMEVHSIPPHALKCILQSHGQLEVFGSSFGIYHLKHTNIDIALPRTENCIGAGHRNFEISINPHLGTKRAAQRRDFTINAIMQNVLTGQIIDHFGGLNDLKNHTLKHVDSSTFVEDPLRVLRGAQFAARFQLNIAAETMQLMKKMDLSTLPRERIAEELSKALLKSNSPATFFWVLRDCQQLNFWFKELEILQKVPQDPKFHPEGDVFNHTMLVLNHAAQLRNASSNPLGFMLSALCHDMGKAQTTVVTPGRIRSIRHEVVGLTSVYNFIQRVFNNKQLLKYVQNMTQLHMRPNVLAVQHSRQKSVNHLMDQSICPKDLLLLAKADYLGTQNPAPYTPIEQYLQNGLYNYNQLMEQPQISAADLMAAGISPGPLVGEGLAYAHKLHLGGVDKNSALKQTVHYLLKK